VGRDLRAELDSIGRLPDGVRKTAALAAWFQGLFPAGTQVPVLVGGAAAEIYSGGAYLSGDLDFVGEVPPEVVRLLEDAGFSRQGRHWVHEQAQVFIEMPGARLEPPEQAVLARTGDCEVVALSPEDVLVDRLAAWQFWRSPVDGAAAFWIWRNLGVGMDLARLEAAARRREVQTALAALREFFGELGSRDPGAEEVTAWARTIF